jgi:hypothetical protein
MRGSSFTLLYLHIETLSSFCFVLSLSCLRQPHHWLFWRSYCPSRCCFSWCLSLSFECLPFVVVSFSFQTYWKYSREMLIAQGSIWWRMISLDKKYKQFIIHKSHRHEAKPLTLMHIIRKEEYAPFKHFDQS